MYPFLFNHNIILNLGEMFFLVRYGSRCSYVNSNYCNCLSLFRQVNKMKKDEINSLEIDGIFYDEISKRLKKPSKKLGKILILITPHMTDDWVKAHFIDKQEVKNEFSIQEKTRS